MRVVSTLASGTEIVCALGCESQLVAISHECDYPDAILDRPRITRTIIDDSKPSGDIDRQVKEATERGESLYVVDVDLLRELTPDVIITQSHCDVCAVSDRDVLGVMSQLPADQQASIVSLDPMSLDGVLADIRKVGDGIGAPDAASRYLSDLEQRLSAIGDRGRAISDRQRKRVVCIEWIEPLMVAANWMPELIDRCGGVVGITEAGTRSGFTAWDDVVAFAPEVIIVMPCGFPLVRSVQESSGLGSLPGWSSLPAVRSQQVYAVDGNAYFNRSGPRLVDSQELLAALVHPDVYPEFRERYAAWYAPLAFDHA
ncbi:MAG: cobalamin-binding protein [Phycisphaerae bacterium]